MVLYSRLMGEWYSCTIPRNPRSPWVQARRVSRCTTATSISRMSSASSVLCRRSRSVRMVPRFDSVPREVAGPPQCASRSKMGDSRCVSAKRARKQVHAACASAFPPNRASTCTGAASSFRTSTYVATSFHSGRASRASGAISRCASPTSRSQRPRGRRLLVDLLSTAHLCFVRRLLGARRHERLLSLRLQARTCPRALFLGIAGHAPHWSDRYNATAP